MSNTNDSHHDGLSWTTVRASNSPRDLVARGRAAGIVVVAATQRTGSDIISTSLRGLFGYRWAFRCTTDTSSDIVLGHWLGVSRTDRRRHTPVDQDVGLPLAERGEPRRLQAALLDDDHVHRITEHAALRRLAHCIAERRHSGGAA